MRTQINAHRDQGQYRKWCKLNKFESILPEDTKARHAELLEKTLNQTYVPNTDGDDRDEVGLVRAICVKVQTLQFIPQMICIYCTSRIM